MYYYNKINKKIIKEKIINNKIIKEKIINKMN